MLMKNLKSLKVVAAVLIALAMLAAPALAAGQDLTVGKFLIEIAKVRQLDAVDAMTARNSLANVGIRFGNLDLDKDLTQGDVVLISTAAGLPMSTSTPEAPFDNEQMSIFISTFGPELDRSNDTATTNGDKPRVDPRTKGNGLKKGLYKTPSEPI
jgi:hypothetical protein